MKPDVPKGNTFGAQAVSRSPYQNYSKWNNNNNLNFSGFKLQKR